MAYKPTEANLRKIRSQLEAAQTELIRFPIACYRITKPSAAPKSGLTLKRKRSTAIIKRPRSASPTTRVASTRC